MADRGPLDELAELYFDSGPAALPSHVVPAMQAEPTRAPAEVPPVPGDDAPALPIGQHAGRVTGKALTQLEAQLDRGELDADDLMNLLPKVHKIKATEDQIELQRTGGRVDLPTIHITIGSAGQIRAERVPNCPEEVVEVGEQVTAEKLSMAPPTWLGPAGFSVDLQPIDGGLES